MGDHITYRKSITSEINGKLSADPLFGSRSNGKTPAQIISEAKASVQKKTTSEHGVNNSAQYYKAFFEYYIEN